MYALAAFGTGCGEKSSTHNDHEAHDDDYGALFTPELSLFGSCRVVIVEENRSSTPAHRIEIGIHSGLRGELRERSEWVDELGIKVCFNYLFSV